MSILIKGIDMPKDAEYFSIVFYKKKSYRKEKIMDISEAIQIPTPHGRLIDEDDLTSELTELQDLNLESIAPTILESEE